MRYSAVPCASAVVNLSSRSPQRYGLWDQEGPLEDKSSPAADEERTAMSVSTDELEDGKETEEKASDDAEAVQPPTEVAPEPKKSKKRGGLLRFRNKKLDGGLSCRERIPVGGSPG